MSIIAGVTLRPEKNEAPRRSARTMRGTTNYDNSSGIIDSATTLRLQRLRLLGIIGQRARLLSELAWEASA